jgi:site-specific recombinase XerD
MTPAGMISDKCPNQHKLNIALNVLLNEYNEILADIGKDIKLMDIKSIVSRLRSGSGNGQDFLKYAQARTEMLTKEKRLSYALSYQNTISLLKQYTGRDTLLFKEITRQFLGGFDEFLQSRESKINTIRVYMVNIRAIFNHAINNDVVKGELFPFRKYKIKSEKAVKRSLEILHIQKLMVGPYFPSQQRSVDVFMMIFFLAGINIKDLLYLKHSDFTDGRIRYRRAKTGAEFNIKVFPECQKLFDKYKGQKYLLSFLDVDDSYSHYKNFTKETNIRLRLAAKYACGGIYLSTYYARHSWATLGRKFGISFEDIKQGLGHGQNQVTDTYINYDMIRARVDSAQEIIIKAVCG